MQKSKESDIQKLTGILISIKNIDKCFKQLNIGNSNDLKNNAIAQAACTQFITNIYENKNKLRDETYDKLEFLNKIKIAGARHIASHDYDSVNFIVIYKICKQLSAEAIEIEIQSQLNKIEEELKDELLV